MAEIAAWSPLAVCYTVVGIVFYNWAMGSPNRVGWRDAAAVVAVWPLWLLLICATFPFRRTAKRAAAASAREVIPMPADLGERAVSDWCISIIQSGERGILARAVIALVERERRAVDDMVAKLRAAAPPASDDVVLKEAEALLAALDYHVPLHEFWHAEKERLRAAVLRAKGG